MRRPTARFPVPPSLERAAAVLGVLLVAAFTLAACGATPPPTSGGPPLPGAPDPTPPAPSITRAWSDASGWPGGAVPAAGAAVTIPVGDAVLLDVSPPPLAGLTVDGALVFDERDLHLQADWIMVHGALHVGGSANPFVHAARITLTGAPGDPDVMGMGRAVLGVMGGELVLYGAAAGPSWTRLTDHAAAGDAVLHVEDAGGWAAGDRIVVASTDFEQWSGPQGDAASRDRQVEERVLTAVDGGRLTLDRPLDFFHVGRAETVGGVVVDARAEVARLTRNVVVEGDAATLDPASDRYRFGGHVMAMGASRVRVHGVELRRLGQLGELGRYPLHLHLMGDAGGDVAITGTSLHGLFNRCVAIHGTNDALVRDVVAYDTYGHCVFVEDGVETGNVLERVLALMVRRPAAGDALLASDVGGLGPAAFWITNPDNVLVGNVAASAQGTGFWYALPEHPTGLSARTDVWPRRTPLGAFYGNRARGNGAVGLHVDNGPTADHAATPPTWYRPRVDPSDADSAPATAVFEAFEAFRHRRAGVWLRGDHAVLRGGVLADNPVGATFASDTSVAEGVGFVGETSNVGTPRGWETIGTGGRALPRPWDPGFVLRGFEFYDGDVGVRASRFAGYVPNEQRGAAALSVLDFTGFSMSPRSFAEDLVFAADTHRVHFALRPLDVAGDVREDGYRSALFEDRDGSVAGTAGRVVAVDAPHLDAPGCVRRSDWNALVCPGRHASLALRAVAGPAPTAPVTLERADGAAHGMLGSPGDTPARYFRALVPLGHPFAYAFDGAPDHLQVLLYDVLPGEALRVSLPWAGAAPSVYRDWWIDARNELPVYASVAELDSASGAGMHFDGVRLHLRLAVQDGRDYAQVEVCRTALCG
jgi:hypothetical protein